MKTTKKTAKERAFDFAKSWYACDFSSDSAAADDNERRIAGLAKGVESLLKEQDKLTRHAIAEKMAKDNKAHATAMNTREGIE
jgi:hypothetical protein